MIATLGRKTLPVLVYIFRYLKKKELLTVKLKFIIILLNLNNQIFCVIVNMAHFHLASYELSKSESKQGVGLLSAKNTCNAF